MNACFEEMLQHRKSLLDGGSAGDDRQKLHQKDDYSYEGVLPSPAFLDLRRLLHMLGISPLMISRSLLAGSEHRHCCSSFKHCHFCSAPGYHSVLFQRPSESIRPFHKVPLDGTCRACEREIPYVINTSILEAPFRCPCCRTRYGSSFSISNLRPARREGRIAIHRRCIARAVA
ncbi:hypothetical protein SAMN05414139_10874 [Burkholderia sp. D7]|nr:hypothetical protein SAMN05414139_10874 [Burkholderia sp. D7]